MEKYKPVFREIAMAQIAMDPDQPRKEFGVKGEHNRLLVSIKDMGIEMPLAVSEIDKDRYLILDGHRRFECAKEIGLTDVPCRVYPKMDPGEFELRRFEIQNNKRQWTPAERSNAFVKIKAAMGFKTMVELADALHLSHSTVNYALKMRDQNVEHIAMMERYQLKESYRVEFLKMKPKIRKIKNLEVDAIIRIIFEKISHDVITNAQDIRILKRVFLRAAVNEEALYAFLSDPDMTIQELEERSQQSGFSLLIDELIQAITGKKKNAVEFSTDEKPMLQQLKKLLIELI